MSAMSSTFPMENFDVVERVDVETDFDGTEDVLVNVGGVWKKCSTQILAELVEDLLV